jgi:DNA replicative helicase MCM subunit Mcm2 (Cdc46/Mcm family)
MADLPKVKILLLGDTAVGKTTFLSYVDPQFPFQGFFCRSTISHHDLSNLLLLSLHELQPTQMIGE